MRKQLWPTLLAATAAQSAAAQLTGDGNGDELRRTVDQPSSWVTQAAERVPDPLRAMQAE